MVEEKIFVGERIEHCGGGAGAGTRDEKKKDSLGEWNNIW